MGQGGPPCDWKAEDWGLETKDWGLETKDWGLETKDWGLETKRQHIPEYVLP